MSSGDFFATNDLYMTIKDGSATPEKVRLLVPGFEILEELGRGAFGVVYRARDEKLDRLVAIKIPLIDDPALCEQYVKEAKNAAKLEYPGIVPVYQVGTLENGQPFVVQRLIDGTTLRKMLNESGSVTFLRACVLMAEIAGAVARAHEVGMIHRDLKPDNILIDSVGKPWVADFGLAILEDEQQHHRGERAGTPLYMSPEQLQGRADWLDGRADIYALGVMLYELLVGRPPFEAKTLKELEEQVFYRDARPLSQRLPNLPVDLDVIFQNCCAKKVTDRYASANELVADLRTVAEEYSSADTVVEMASEGALPGPLTKRSAVITRKTQQQRMSLSSRRNLLKESMSDQVHSRSKFRLLVGTAAGILVVAGLSYAFWPKREPPAAPPVHSPGDVGISSGQSEPLQPKPVRPFRVARSGGTHTSIQAAINDSNENETIRIGPGTYTESLVLTSKVTLIGEGNAADTIIIGEQAPAITVQDSAVVSLENLACEGNPPTGKDFNTIDLTGGELVVKNCKVDSRSYDSIKVHKGTVLKVHGTNFQSTRHPAIFAVEAKHLEVIDCEFTIRPPTSTAKEIPVGIQVSRCSGQINNCRFRGSGAAKGIQWNDADATILIENCNFENCNFGAIFQDCADVKLSTAGPATARSKLVGCQNGLLFDRSHASVSRFSINHSEGATGIRVLASTKTATDTTGGKSAANEKQPAAARRVTLSNCEIEGYEVGMSVESASLTADALQILDCRSKGVQLVANSQLDLISSTIERGELVGLYVEDSSASLRECEIRSNQHSGVLVYGPKGSLVVEGGMIEKNTAGLIVCDGRTEMNGVDIQHNSGGIFVVSIERALDSAAPAPSAPTIELKLQSVTLANNQGPAMKVSLPCRYELLDSIINDPRNQNRPLLDKGLEAKKNGNTTIVTQTTDGSKRS